ncbi:hypothetical protein ACH4U3_04170 [Streptomyces griseoruber]
MPTLAMAARQPLAPYAPAVVALAVGLLLDNPMPTLEAGVPRRRLYRARAGWYATVLAFATMATAVTLPLAEPSWHGTMLRNAVLLAAVAVLASVAVGGRAAWLVILVLTLPDLLAGGTDDGTPRAWALLAQPPDSPTAVVVTMTLVVLALTCYTRWDARPDLGLADGGT